MQILGSDFQTNLTRLILQDSSFLLNHRGVIDIALFEDSVEKVLVKECLFFFDKYNSTPSDKTMQSILTKRNYLAEEIEDSLDKYYTVPVIDSNFVCDFICDFVRRMAVRDALLTCSDMLEEGNCDEILEIIKKAVFKGSNTNTAGSVFWDQIEKVIESIDVQEQFIPTGIASLDSILGGGMVRGTLNVIITPPSRGKSTVLVNLGRMAVLSGYKVVHYSFELSEKIVQRRYVMSMLKMSKTEIKNKKFTAYDKMMNIANTTMRDSLLIKKFPANCISPGDVRRHISSIRNQFGFIPSLFIFDYADLIAPQKSMDIRRLEIESIYYDLRNIAEETNGVVWTASQTSKTWIDKDIITMEDVDECYKKAAASDTMISVNQTLAERRLTPQRARLFLTKARDDTSQVEIPICTDWSRSWIGE